MIKNPFRELLGAPGASPFERTVLLLCGASGVLILALWPLPVDRFSPFWADLLAWLAAGSLLVFALSFVVLGILIVGRAAGKRTFGAQARFTFGRVFWYLLLPCLLFAIGSVIWMVLTGRL